MSSSLEGPARFDFQVWVDGGAITTGYNDEEVAQADADRRNAQAEAMGLKARYVVRARS